ncbi:MAG: trigger factor [Candidatus Baltobacteraceae bacterium]
MTATTVKRLDPTQVELEIAISPQELAAARERAFRELSSGVRIPGFRPGKAPRRIFEANYGTSAIEERAMEKIVPDAYSRAVRDNGLEPVDEPVMELVPPEEGDEGSVRLKAVVAVRPTIELGSYKGIALTAPPLDVRDDEVERSLEVLRREQATLVPVDRPVALADIATLDFEGTIEGAPFEGGSAKNQPTEVAAERFIPGFAEGIVGMQAGDSRTVEARFPDDYSVAELAGKAAQFAVTVHDVKVAELPPLDDEFAARFGSEGATLEGLRADIRRRIGDARRTRVRQRMTGELLEHLRAGHEIALPEVLLTRESASLLEESKAEAKRAGLTWDEYLARHETTEDATAERLRDEAGRRVKNALLLEAIAKAEKIEATKAEVEGEIATLAARYGQSREEIRRLVAPNLNGMIEGIVRSKTLEFLLDSAAVTTAPDVSGDEADATSDLGA